MIRAISIENTHSGTERCFRADRNSNTLTCNSYSCNDHERFVSVLIFVWLAGGTELRYSGRALQTPSINPILN